MRRWATVVERKWKDVDVPAAMACRHSGNQPNGDSGLIAVVSGFTSSSIQLTRSLGRFNYDIMDL